MIKKWKTLSTEYLFRRPWLTARRDCVQLPSGKIHDEYYILEYPTWINVIALTEDGDFVMVSQYRHGIGEIMTELVAGVAEKGEEPLEAARRELMEETGFGGGEWSLFTKICANPGSMNNFSYSFIAKGVHKVSEQHLDDTEDVEVVIMKREDVLDMLKRDEVKQSLMAAPLWKYFYFEKNS